MAECSNCGSNIDKSDKSDKSNEQQLNDPACLPPLLELNINPNKEYYDDKTRKCSEPKIEEPSESIPIPIENKSLHNIVHVAEPYTDDSDEQLYVNICLTFDEILSLSDKIQHSLHLF